MTQQTTDSWAPLEESAEVVARTYPQPLMALAEGTVPAFVIRGAYPAEDCRALMQRFDERGYFSRETVGVESQLSGGSYLDLGTSLGRLASDREAFFAHAQRTHELFPNLFSGLADPVDTIYRNLFALAAGKRVQTAVAKDGRRFGPAIFRIYQSEEGHKPHYDSIRRRTKSSYEVARFTHQFAAVLCVKKGSIGGDSILYRAKAEGKVEEAIGQEAFEVYAEQNNVPSVRVELDAGDLYFFYTENVHEVPPVDRDETRVVLAAFIAMSPDDDEIYVWS